MDTERGSESSTPVRNPKPIPAASQAGCAPSRALTATLTPGWAHSDSSAPALPGPALAPGSRRGCPCPHPQHGEPAGCAGPLRAQQGAFYARGFRRGPFKSAAL